MNSFQYKEPLYFSTELDFVILVSLSITGALINLKFLKDMKDDARKSSSSLIDNVMAARTKSIMAVVPTFMLLHWSLTLNHRFPDWFYHSLCYEQYNLMFWRFYFGFTSLIIALMRYFFIVHNEKALLLGKQRMKRFFELLNIIVPLIMTVLHACTLPVPPTSYNAAQKICYEFLDVSHNMMCRDPNRIMDNCARILTIVIERILTAVTNIVGIIVKIMYFMTSTFSLKSLAYKFFYVANSFIF